MKIYDRENQQGLVLTLSKKEWSVYLVRDIAIQLFFLLYWVIYFFISWTSLSYSLNLFDEGGTLQLCFREWVSLRLKVILFLI